jgi:hypothetical protein
MTSKLRKYAKAASSASHARDRCATCRDYPAALDSIEAFCAAQDAGDPDFRDLPIASEPHRPSLQTFLREEFDYQLCENALRRHVTRCVRGKKKG